jgi:hypothetical protein
LSSTRNDNNLNPRTPGNHNWKKKKKKKKGVKTEKENSQTHAFSSSPNPKKFFQSSAGLTMDRVDFFFFFFFLVFWVNYLLNGARSHIAKASIEENFQQVGGEIPARNTLAERE